MLSEVHQNGMTLRRRVGKPEEFFSASGGWYRTVANTLPEHVWACTVNGSSWFNNERVLEYTGRPSAELLGTGWLQTLHPEDREYVKLAWKIATASGGVFEAEYRIRRHDGQYHWFHARALPVTRPDGETTDWFGTSTDVDDLRRRTLHASILQAIVRELSAEQNVGDVIERVARICLGPFASFCIFDVYDRDFGLARLAFVHVDAALEARLHDRVFEMARHVGRANDPFARAIHERKTQISRAPSDLPYTRLRSPEEDHADSLTALERVTKIIVPVCEPDGELVGILTFGEAHDDASRLAELNEPFAEQIASLLSRTFVRAREAARAEHHRCTVDRIVRSSLPGVLPATDRIEFDAVYAPGRTRLDVGAAWYDAMWLPDGRLMLSSGNVAGTGIDAALAMASLRQTLRAAAFLNAEPVAATEVADKVLRSLNAERLAAVFFGYYEPVAREMRYALRGHPRPVVRLADGSPRQLPGSGSTPLGFGEMTAAKLNEYRLQIPPDALLLVHTGNLSGASAFPDPDHDATLLNAIRQIDPHWRPASELLDRLCGARGCLNDVAVMTALFR